MKSLKFFYPLLIILLASFTSNDSDCRNFAWGTTADVVKKQEKCSFVEEKALAHNLRGVTFMDYQPEATYFHTYIFHNGGLYGVKTRRVSLSGDNSKLNALSEYSQALTKYTSSCLKGQLTERKDNSEQGLKTFEVVYPNKTVFVNIEKESVDYFLVETTMKKGVKKI